MKSFTHTLVFKRETKGTWVYEAQLAEGQRISGSNAAYLLKAEYPQKPCEKIEVSYKLL
jgi:hypothetical protein